MSADKAARELKESFKAVNLEKAIELVLDFVSKKVFCESFERAFISRLVRCALLDDCEQLKKCVKELLEYYIVEYHTELLPKTGG